MDSASWLHGAYIVTAIFGLGVTVVDFLGLLAGGGGHAHAASDGGGGHGGGHGDGHGDPYHAGAEGVDGPHHAQSSILVFMRRLRLAVYFSLGFGAIGLAAEVTGSGPLGSLAWAVPGGLVCAVLARAMFRFQQRDVDSSLTEDELLAQRAEVIVPLSDRDMGRVRVRIGYFTVERYALAEDEDTRFVREDPVEIVRIGPECVYVRRAP